MSLGGLIGSVMKPAAEAGAKYAEKRVDLDIKKELMDAEEQKLLRIDEIKRQRDIADIPARGEAETGVMVEREDALRPSKIKTEEETTLARGKAERTNLTAYGADAGARAGARAKASDSESSGTKAQGALANFKLTQEKAIADLRTELKDTKDPTQRAEIEQQIKDLSGSLTTKSYTDMVTAADAYRKMAQNLRKDAENVYEETDRQSLLDRAQKYEMEADAILQAAKGQRLPGSSKPKGDDGAAAAKPTGGSKPWERNWNTPKNVSDTVAP